MRTFAFIILFLICKYYCEDDCETCHSLVREFNNNLQRTDKDNFGGGNTAWEEQRLGQFSTSETRLIHVLETVCDYAKGTRCQSLREEAEENIEYWWFNYFKKDQELRNLDLYLCVEQLNLCCKPGFYGKDCKQCKYENCGRGSCDGNGTKSGEGHCVCDKGYEGDVCDQCKIDYYLNKEYNVCEKCDTSCSSCNGSSNTNCIECAKGYQREEGTCVDINECLIQNCTAGFYCENSDGSYECKACDESCKGCSDKGNNNCESCAQGYQKINEICEDINECSADSGFCREEGQECFNFPGGYNCKCNPQYKRNSDGRCLKKQTSKSKPVDDTQRQFNNKKSSNNKRRAKKIWTPKFEKEFFKLLCCIFFLGVVCYFLGKYTFIVSIFAIVCGYYVYLKSINLDHIFSKSIIK